jgi:myosin heavy subunit
MAHCWDSVRREDDDLTTISNIDIDKVNNTIRNRYDRDAVYVS